MRSDNSDRNLAAHDPEPKPAEPEVPPTATRDTCDALTELAALVAGLADQVPGAHGIAAQLRRLRASLG